MLENLFYEDGEITLRYVENDESVNVTVDFIQQKIDKISNIIMLSASLKKAPINNMIKCLISMKFTWRHTRMKNDNASDIMH